MREFSFLELNLTCFKSKTTTFFFVVFVFVGLQTAAAADGTV